MLNNPEFDEISTTVAARLLKLSVRHIQRLCVRGAFEFCYRPGYGSRAHFRLSRAEVLSRRTKALKNHEPK